MMKTYLIPEISVVPFDADDVITTSGPFVEGGIKTSNGMDASTFTWTDLF